jgi:hypothetical protein
MGFQGFTTSDNFRGGGEEPRLWSHKSLSAMDLDLDLNLDHRLLASKFHLLRAVQSILYSRKVQEGAELIVCRGRMAKLPKLTTSSIYFPVLGMVDMLVNINMSFAA